MESVKRLIERDKCTGCEACVESCPVKAINMEKDKDGFYFPVIQENNCINCGFCGKVCPVEKENTFRKIDYNDSLAYGGYNTNIEELRSSTSGGFFGVLATYVINRDGIVFGVVYRDDFRNVVYDSSYTISINAMKGSKYVTAHKKGVYGRVKKELESRRLVLFVGLPCEIAGLFAVLKKDYDNLITCELICAGPASYNLHDAQLDWIENKYKGKTSYFSYRSKKYGWVPLCLKAKNGNHVYDTVYENTLFGIGFPYAKRLACFNCWYKDTRRLADFTIGDFWRVNRGTEYYNEEGTSVVFARTTKAENIINNLDGFKKVKVDQEVALRGNYTQLKTSSEIPRQREEYLKTLRSQGPNMSAYIKYKPNMNMKTKIKKSLPPTIYRFLRRFDNGKF